MLAILLFLDIVKYFIDEKYWGGLHVVPVLLTANLLLGVYYNFSIWYRLRDRTGLGALISVAGAALTIGFNLLLIPIFGYTGAAYVTVLCYGFMCFATWNTGRRHYPVPYPLRRMGAYVLGAYGLWGAGLLAAQVAGDWPALVWAARVLLMAVFVAAVYYFEIRKR
jgi:O-antigen/teichoic acid export membrane protein